MLGKKKLDEKRLALPEVKKILEERKEKGELLYEQSIALDHLMKFCKLDVKNAQKLKEELIEIEVPPDVAVKITDILPEDKHDLGVIFAKERHILGDEETEKILEIVKKYK
jgi:DNA-directed RNA polymerase subunit F